MKKWYDEEYEFEVEVVGFLRGERTERYCRNGEEVGDRYTCTYGCPVNAQGYGICSKTMMLLYPIMEAVRSGGDLVKVGGDGRYTKEIVCPDGCVLFRLTARPRGTGNFSTAGFFRRESGGNGKAPRPPSWECGGLSHALIPVRRRPGRRPRPHPRRPRRRRPPPPHR